jgi:hypothetical protein
VPRDAAPLQPADKVFVTGAGRCGECHEKMYDEWESSAHARAATSTAYRAAVAAANDPTCDRCHAPLAEPTAHDIVATEGVTCDVCHTLRPHAPAANPAALRLAIDDVVKYGPRCDLPDHYFHRMGCSPEHKQAVLCGACHWWQPGGLPVFTEYADWRAGPAADTACQTCHMPAGRAALAVGSPVRDGVPHHGMLGVASDLRRRALALEVASRDDAAADRLVVDVTLTNAGAGHHVPAGLPERRLAVRVAVGGELQTRELGRVLVDAAGAEAPFWRAVRVASDTRIAPRAAWRGRFEFRTRGAVAVDVVERSLSDVVARELGVEVEEHALTSARAARGKTVIVKPPPAVRRVRP